MNQHSSTDSSVSSSNGASAEAISRRAYEIWEREGRPEGCDLRHWLQAEQELGVRRSDNRREAESNGNARFSTSTPARSSTTSSESRPVQSSRPAPTRETKRSSNSPFGAEKTATPGNQNAAKRKPTSAPVM